MWKPSVRQWVATWAALLLGFWLWIHFGELTGVHLFIAAVAALLIWMQEARKTPPKS